MILRETRERAAQLRTEAQDAVTAVRAGADAMSHAGTAISRASVLVGTVAIAALGVALLTLYLLLNRTDRTNAGA